MIQNHDTPPELSIVRTDIERRLGFPAGPFTQPGAVLSLLTATLLTIGFYAALIPLGPHWEHFANSFLERGWVPYAIVFMSSWALMIILIKAAKVRAQSKALGYRIIPEDTDFVLTIQNVDRIIERLYAIAEDPRAYLLYNRIYFALSNLKNMGRIGDVDEVLRGRAEGDESAVESSYTIVRGLIWGIPVLGFIGTVIGLSQAIGSFAGVLEGSSSDMGNLKAELQNVTGGLATAFETTLQALLAALLIQLLMTFVKRNEERMLDRFNDYCDTQVVGRLRIDAGPTREPGP